MKKKKPMTVPYLAVFLLSIFMIFFAPLFSAAFGGSASGGGVGIVYWGYTVWMMHKRNNKALVAWHKGFFWVGVLVIGVVSLLMVFPYSPMIQYIRPMPFYLLGGISVLSALFLYRFFLYHQKREEGGLIDGLVGVTSKPLARDITGALSTPRSDDWASALAEYESDRREKGLWAKLYAENNGDEAKIKAAYLNVRAVAFSLGHTDSQTRAGLNDVSDVGMKDTKVLNTNSSQSSTSGSTGKSRLLGFLLIAGGLASAALVLEASGLFTFGQSGLNSDPVQSSTGPIDASGYGQSDRGATEQRSASIQPSERPLYYIAHDGERLRWRLDKPCFVDADLDWNQKEPLNLRLTDMKNNSSTREIVQEDQLIAIIYIGQNSKEFIDIFLDKSAFLRIKNLCEK